MKEKNLNSSSSYGNISVFHFGEDWIFTEFLLETLLEYLLSFFLF